MSRTGIAVVDKIFYGSKIDSAMAATARGRTTVKSVFKRLKMDKSKVSFQDIKSIEGATVPVARLERGPKRTLQFWLLVRLDVAPLVTGSGERPLATVVGASILSFRAANNWHL